MGTTSICNCCGRIVHPFGGARTDGGRMHFDCWDLHHSDPTGPWPPDHRCVASASEPTSAEADHSTLATIADLVRPIAEIRDHGTHYADCHNWHVGCLARLVLQLANPTASQRPNEGK